MFATGRQFARKVAISPRSHLICCGKPFFAHSQKRKIKTSSRINQARLKDRRPHGPHLPRARIERHRAAMATLTSHAGAIRTDA
jgi:hypothetical protein